MINFFSPLVLIDMTLDSDTYPMSSDSTLGVDLTLSNSSISSASMYNKLNYSKKLVILI